MHTEPTTPGQNQPTGSVLAGSQPHLEATLHALQTTQLPNLLPAAGDNLYRWMNLLQTAEGDQFVALIAELQNLYNALGHGSPNGAQVKQSLRKLAELTTQAAAAAEAGAREKVLALGQSLSAAAATL